MRASNTRSAIAAAPIEISRLRPAPPRLTAPGNRRLPNLQRTKDLTSRVTLCPLTISRLLPLLPDRYHALALDLTRHSGSVALVSGSRRNRHPRYSALGRPATKKIKFRGSRFRGSRFRRSFHLLADGVGLARRREFLAAARAGSDVTHAENGDGQEQQDCADDFVPAGPCPGDKTQDDADQPTDERHDQTEERNDLQHASASVTRWRGRFGSLDDLLGRSQSVEHIAHRRFTGGILLAQRVSMWPRISATSSVRRAAACGLRHVRAGAGNPRSGGQSPWCPSPFPTHDRPPSARACPPDRVSDVLYRPSDLQ